MKEILDAEMDDALVQIGRSIAAVAKATHTMSIMIDTLREGGINHALLCLASAASHLASARMQAQCAANMVDDIIDHARDCRTQNGAHHETELF